MFQEMLWNKQNLIPGFVYVICHVAFIIIFMSAISAFSQNSTQFLKTFLLLKF